MMESTRRYIIEARNGPYLASSAECETRRILHPYLFSKASFAIDELCHWASFGESREQPCGPSETFAMLSAFGLPAREKTW